MILGPYVLPHECASPLGLCLSFQGWGVKVGLG